MKLRTQALALCASVLAVGGLSQAAVVTFGPFPIDGSQEVGPVATPGSGTGIVTLDTTTNSLSWIINWENLTGPISGMHFHGPANPGQNAGVRVNIGAISGLTSPSAGSTNISAALAAELQSGMWYVNLHTAANPGGEIRGQAVGPAPACDGDANGDNVVDVNDISYVLFRLGVPCP